MRLTLLPILFAAVACSGDSKEDSAAGTTGATEAGEPTESSGAEIPDASVCDEEYSFCGHIVTPPDFTGTPRSLAIALYTSVPPAGPPNAIVTEIAAPSMGPNERYPVRIAPMIETGEYYIWANLYMEGGGEWVPENDIDYTGATGSAVKLEGSSIQFGDIVLELASGW